MPTLPPSYPVIFFQAPDTETLWQKSKNYGRDLRLKCVAYRDPRRRICLIDQLENMACDKFGRRRAFHIAIDCFPGFCQVGFVSRVVLRTFTHGVVKRGANVARLKSDNGHLLICEF